jgi:hypothetical protein
MSCVVPFLSGLFQRLVFLAPQASRALWSEDFKPGANLEPSSVHKKVPLFDHIHSRCHSEARELWRAKRPRKRPPNGGTQLLPLTRSLRPPGWRNQCTGWPLSPTHMHMHVHVNVHVHVHPRHITPFTNPSPRHTYYTFNICLGKCPGEPAQAPPSAASNCPPCRW